MWHDNLLQVGWEPTAGEGILLPLGHGCCCFVGWLWFVVGNCKLNLVGESGFLF
jgi:hypothetical protein